MSTQIKPIKLYGQGGPNPPKVNMIIEELNLPHEIIALSTSQSDVKSAAYLAINPNGRLPAIQDPNTDLTLWESGAIIEYLIEKYDHSRKLSFEPGSNEAYLTKQWLFFQTSGQGPYFGQAAWFAKFHHEQIPSAKERYNAEVARVSGVLEGWLAKQKEQYADQAGFDGPWLVGNKISYADIAFVPWHKIIAMILGKNFDEDKFPLVKAWVGKMGERPVVKKVFDASMAAVAAHQAKEAKK